MHTVNQIPLEGNDCIAVKQFFNFVLELKRSTILQSKLQKITILVANIHNLYNVCILINTLQGHGQLARFDHLPQI